MFGSHLMIQHLGSLTRLFVPLLAIMFACMSSVYAGIAQDQLDAFVQEVETFQANFEQTLYDADGESLQVSKGTIKLKRPGRFIWTYTEPADQEIVADGERIWLYDKELEQVTVNTIDDRIAGTPFALLMRSEPLEQSFDITELGASDEVNWLELSPLSESSDFELIFIGLDDNGLAALELRDNFGQATQIVFTDFEAGIELDDALFAFKAPDGVDVIGLEQ